MNLEIDKSILDKFGDEIKVFFYEAGCEGTKINITEDFEKDGLSFFELNGKKVFYEKKDENNLDSGKIFPKKEDNLEQNSEHSENDKYLFISPKVKGRCGCATSFSFERKLIDKDKLNKLKNVFRK